jgi:Metallo-beta-lactamase superfamily
VAAARIWGCRGSLPTPGEATVRYGGNTSCVEIRTHDGVALILDAGTGIRRLGDEVDPTAEIHVLLTHLHLDHLEGLRFFAPLWHDGARVHIWGPGSPVHSLQERISRSFSPPLFPVDLADIPATVAFHDVGARRRPTQGAGRLPSGIDGRISTRAGKRLAGVHPRPRARTRRRARSARAGMDLGPRARRRRRRPRSRLPVHRGGVRRASRVGALERRARRRLRAEGRRWPPGALPPRSRSKRCRRRPVDGARSRAVGRKWVSGSTRGS